MDFSEISKSLTSNIDKNVKKNNGIYFTPPSVIKVNIEYLSSYLKKDIKILEPSCGSCEFINALLKENKSFKITGIENNKQIYDRVKDLYDKDNVEIIYYDFLKWLPEEKYDLIIGNPPYFVMNKKSVENEFYEYFDGRPNIFILFIIKCLKLLKEDGILSFVLPSNFMNCLYYDKTRKYIENNFTILNILECNNDFIETKQETVIIVLQNKKPTIKSKFIINVSNYSIFADEIKVSKIKELYKNSKTLDELGFQANVGNIVWNQHKKILTNYTTKTRLIYSANIENNKFVDKDFKNKEKKKYIQKTGINGPLLLLNRGYGVGKYSFNYCLFDEDFNFLVENHLICIRSKEKLEKNILIDKYRKLISSFENEKTKKFIEIYFGNNAINISELTNIIPFY